MWRNYLKLAWRNIIRKRTFSLLNIFGLATGIAAAVLLFVVISYELSYNKSFPQSDQVFHLYTHGVYPDGEDVNPGVPVPALKALRTDFPDVSTGVLYASFGSQITVLNQDSTINSEKKFIESPGLFFADGNMFRILQYKWLSGNASLLEQPNTAVLTKKIAEKYFGNWSSAQGRLLQIDNNITVRVAGVLEDVPANTDYQLSVVISYSSLTNHTARYDLEDDWGSLGSDFQVFMLIPPAKQDAMTAQLQSFSTKHYPQHGVVKRTICLQPLSTVHHDPNMGNWSDHTTSMATIRTLSLIGIFILLMACINFINLSTAQAINRSKEMGVRKVLGGQRSSLFWQNMGETALIVLLATLAGVAMAMICLPFISHVASIEETLNLLSVDVLLFLILLAIVITFLSGFYPALIVSGFKPILALKNKITSASVGGISLRRALVVIQFGISQVLIIGTIVAVSQMNFVRKADLGFNKEAILEYTTSLDSVVTARQPALKQELLSLPGVAMVSFNTDAPSSDNNSATNFAFNHEKDKDYALYLKFGDADYFKTFGIRFAAGTGYAATDTVRDVVINETLRKKLGLATAADAIGKDIRMGSQRWRKIVGVVEDFKTNSLREETKPLMIAAQKRAYTNLAIKLKSTDLVGMKAAIDQVWNRHLPAYANGSRFVDETIANFYRQETQLSLLYRIFAGIAIFISCLGLYGLVSFMAAQRTKEVGIRKVLGASAAQIVYLFSKEFALLIGISFLIAAPLGWYMMNDWLTNFAYRISIGVGVFILAIVLTIVVAMLTVGYKSIKAAKKNPVNSLRTE